VDKKSRKTVIAVSVIIPHFDDLENLDRCLSLLELQTFPRASFEIIIADNNSRCGLEAVRTIAGERANVVLASEQGAGPARNMGVAQAQGQYLAFVDSDCRPAPGWLKSGIEALKNYDIVGGQVIIEADDPAHLRPVEAFETVFAFRFEDYIKKKGFTGSGNMFVRRATFLRVGGFRKHLSEDVEWCHRARTMGLKLGYEPNAIVGHPPRRDWNELSHKWRRIVSESYTLQCERPLGRIRWFAQSWAVLLSAIPHTFTVLHSPSLRGLKDRTGAIAVLVRIRAFRFVEAQRLLLTRH
jgi:GT2 family glycosyltransferase